jgi:hypothetical protein
MKITFKLYASLTDYLPPDKRRSNQMRAGGGGRRTTIARSSSPLAADEDGAPGADQRRLRAARAARHAHAGRRRRAGHLAAHRRAAEAHVPAHVPEAFTREYGCTTADWLRALPGAVGGTPALDLPAPGQARFALSAAAR